MTTPLAEAQLLAAPGQNDTAMVLILEQPVLVLQVLAPVLLNRNLEVVSLSNT